MILLRGTNIWISFYSSEGSRAGLRAHHEDEEAPGPVCGEVPGENPEAEVEQHAADVTPQASGIRAADAHLSHAFSALWHSPACGQTTIR